MIEKYFKIENLENKNLAPFKTLKFSNEHSFRGTFIAEGEKVVERLLKSKLKTISVLMSEKWKTKFFRLINKKDEKITIFLASEKLLETIVGHKLHQSIMALGKIPKSTTIKKIYKLNKSKKIFVAIDDIMNSENLGVIIRNCAAFGVDGIIVGETCANPYLRRSVRNSMGNIFKLPIIYSENLKESLIELQNYGCNIFIAHTSKKSKTISEINFKNDSCIIFGNEERGARKIILENFHSHLIIPMQNKVDSLNVANSAAVLLYEIQRQRKN